MILGVGFEKALIIQKTNIQRTIPLRTSRLENLVKLSLQYPNYFPDRYFGVMGTGSRESDKMTISERE